MHRNAMLMRRIRFIDNPPEDNGGSDGGEGDRLGGEIPRRGKALP